MNSILFLLIVGSIVSAAAGYLGSFMVLKRMSLVGDALSHVALPGMAIALMLHISPTLGAFVTLMLAVIGIWYLGETSQIYPEALVGIFFTASLAIGILITPKPELLEALFGNIERITLAEGIVTTITSLIVIIVAKYLSKQLVLDTISTELAKSTGVPTSRNNLIYLVLVGAVVALGIRFLGTLLTGALVIIPAASAKNISLGMMQYQTLSILFGILSALLGIVVSSLTHFSPGPIVVLSSIFIFLATYLGSAFSKK